MGYNFDKKIKKGKYEIEISTEDGYGYFEHDLYGEDDGGSFDIENGEVVDIDGCYAIPKEVADGILELGVKIDIDLFCM